MDDFHLVDSGIADALGLLEQRPRRRDDFGE
jgi:hypothetical protein